MLHGFGGGGTTRALHAEEEGNLLKITVGLFGPDDELPDRPQKISQLLIQLSDSGYKYLSNILSNEMGTGNPVGTSATLNDDKLEGSVGKLVDSVAFDKEKAVFSFTIPDDLPTVYSFDILVAGRIKMGDGGMSAHFFEEETESGAWEPGKTYSQEFEQDSLLSLSMLVGAVSKEEPIATTSKLLYGTEISIDENGDISYLSNEIQSSRG
jgi:hypothetical protein